MGTLDILRQRIYGRTFSEQKKNVEAEAWETPRGKGASAAGGKDGIAREQFAAKRLQEMGVDRIQRVETHAGGHLSFNPIGRDEQYDRIVPGVKYDEQRRSFLKKALSVGGAVGVTALASGTVGNLIGRAQAAPGAGRNGATLSPTDIDAKRIGGMRYATEFDAASHAGTSGDPFTGTAISGSLTDLPAFGGAVFLPASTYLLSAGITMLSNVNMKGAGPASIIKRNAGNNARLFFHDHLSNVTYDGLLFNDNSPTVTSTGTNECLFFASSSDVIIRSCHFINGVFRVISLGLGYSPVVSQNKRFTISGDLFTGCALDAIFTAGAQVSVSDSVFDGIGDSCLDIGGDSAVFYAKDSEVTACSMRDFVVGVFLAKSVTNITVGTNSFEPIRTSGVPINATESGEASGPLDCSILGNTILGIGATSTVAGMVLSKCHRISLLGNVIQKMNKGITLTACDDIDLVGGLVRRCNHTAIELASASARCRFQDAKLLENAQAASTDPAVLIYGCDGNSVIANLIADYQGTATQQDGVQIGSTSSKNIVKLNDIINNLRYGVYLTGAGVADTVVENNYFDGNGSATVQDGGTSTVKRYNSDDP